MSATFYHLQEIDYPQHFPTAVDEVPVMLQKKTFIDAWVFNRIYAMTQAVQQYIINNKSRIEA